MSEGKRTVNYLFENLPVSLEYFVRRKTAAGWDIPMRTIANHELVVVVQGTGEAVLEGTRHRLKAGDVLYFYPGLRHSMSVQDAPYMEFFGVHFSLPHGLPRLPLPELQHFQHTGRLYTALTALQEIHVQKPYLYRWQENLLLEQVLCEVFCAAQRRDAPAQVRRIGQALSYIQANLHRPLRLSELTQLAQVKKSLFVQNFKQITGMSPMQYVAHSRMKRARELLLEQTGTVAQIAAQCGYDDALYFSRCFQKQFGCSPTAFRKREGAAQLER